jgi:hypothetical protein
MAPRKGSNEAEPLLAKEDSVPMPMVTDADEIMAAPTASPPTLLGRVAAFSLACLVWLGLANPPPQAPGTAVDMDGPKPEVAPLSDKATKYKLFALLCTCLLSVGSHYASHMLSALKSTLKEVRSRPCARPRRVGMD